MIGRFSRRCSVTITACAGEELCNLNVKDLQSREGVIHFKVKGKRGRRWCVPTHPQAQRLIESYLMMACHGGRQRRPLFRPVRDNRTGELGRPLNANSFIGISSESTDR